MADLSNEELIDRGERMERLLAEPLLIEAKEKLAAEIYEAWKSADTPQKREALHAKHSCLDALFSEMKKVVEKKEYAKHAQQRATRPPSR